MIPSLVAREIKEGIRQYLITGFEPSNATFKGIVREYVDTPGNLSKGPYLSIGLPFRKTALGRDYFPGFQTRKRPYLHQEIAWRRLRGDLHPASTLIATGTGSGKTECFMYPLLQHCLSERLAGRAQGIKALVIYPMNALGSDQARRFAEAVQASANLRGRLRVGLYVGEGEGGTPGADAMGPENVITLKEAMRSDPPDILLTNYKMLDYLLIRPKDQPLWRYNGPDTLRYLVVDELHTFDGAQGTDLALLIRRLKARLKTPERSLVCVGTSATLGAADQAAALVAYAQEIFGEPFDAQAVVIEDRLTMAEFIGNAIIEHQFWLAGDLERLLDPRSYPTLEKAIAGWHAAFFPEDPAANPTDPRWRVELGEKLKRQLQFNNLLRLLVQQPRSLEELAHELPRFLPPPAKPYPGPILDTLLALVAWARDPDPEDPNLPFVQLRLQLWLREQRRMVLRLTSRGQARQLVSADDLKTSQGQVFLPLVQCSDCRASAWLTRLPAGSQYIDRDLRAVYDAFFNHKDDLALLYPAADVPAAGIRGESRHVCGACGQLQAATESCQSCGSEDLLAVFRPLTARRVTHHHATRVVADHLCPVCGGEDTLLLFGARATSLSAVAIQHLWGSKANDHRQLIAFSDSVQDAAHRAGFFAARTYANNLRMAIVQALAGGKTGTVPWADFLATLPGYWLDRAANPKAMTPERFVVEFIGPDMLWLADYEKLCETGRLDGRWLLDAVSKRLQWEAIGEFGYQSRRGRSLERTGCAALGIQPVPVAKALERSGQQLREHLGLRELSDDNIRWFVWGFLLHLKHRGAIDTDLIRRYIERGGRPYLIGADVHFLPNYGPHSPRPLFFSAAARHPEFDTAAQTNRTTWYQHWLNKALAPNTLIPNGIESDVYQAVCQELIATGVLNAHDSRDGPVLALNPDALFLEPSTARLATPDGGSELVVPDTLAAPLEGMPALDLAVPGHYRRAADPHHWLAYLYHTGTLRRVIAAEHTGLLERAEREALESRFKKDAGAPWNENLLSATPTLEMGADIGNLSAVLLCSVPPTQANYLQRSGRAGRRDGNALTLTMNYSDPLLRQGSEFRGREPAAASS